MIDYNTFLVKFNEEFEKQFDNNLYYLSIFYHQLILFLNILNHFVEIDLDDLDNHEEINKIYSNYLKHYFEFQTFHSIEYDNFTSDIYNLKIIKKLIKHYYTIILEKLKEYHLNVILPEFTRINSIDVPEQRTLAWFAQRLKLISASEAYKAININAPSGYKNLILSKLGYSGSRPSGEAINHGVVFEIASQVMYEFRNEIIIKEYGCLPHSKHTFIGASPDGIVCSVKRESNLISQMKLGRMLEIKNPSSRSIIILKDYDQKKYRKFISTGYYYQIQLQLEVCNLQYCDFLETKITYYDNFNDFKKDEYNLLESPTPLNKHIPTTNLNSEGMEKGLIIKIIDFSDQETKIKSILFPLDGDYNQDTFNNWIEKESIKYRNKINSDSFEFVPIYWKCDIYEVKTVERDQTFINEKIIPGLKSCWEEIEQDRLLNYDELRLKYNKYLEYDTSSNNLVDSDEHPKKLRRIEKKEETKIKIVFTNDN
tara:strand:- start:608 stop:2056 length:1449 start_codon:yes stop_codon:yes gene_type:complete